jgi:DNA polymerase-3 subunit alpha
MFNGIMDRKDQKEEYPPKQLLNFEKEMLGLYISGHPLSEFETILTRMTPIAKLPDLEDKATVTIGGIITNIKNIYTKRDQQMCFIDLEDIENNLEVIVFPNVLEKYRELIVEDRIVKMRGKIDKKEDQIKLLANEFSELKKDDSKDIGKERKISEIEKDKITFIIRKNDMNIEFINNFYQILKNNPGKCMVEFKVVNGNEHKPEKTFKLPEDFRVKPGDKLFGDIKKEFTGKVFNE